MFRQNQANIRYRRTVVFIMTALLGWTMLLALSPATTSALQNEGPNPTDLGGTAGEHFGYVLTQGFTYSDVPTTTVPIYFPSDLGKRRITIIDGNLCLDGLESAPSTGGNQYDESLGTNFVNDRAVQFYVQNPVTGANSAAVYSIVSDADDCYRQAITLEFESADFLELHAGTGLYYANFKASVMANIDNAQNRYRIVLEDTNGIVGYSAGNASNAFGIAKQYPYGGYDNYLLPFAPDCTVADNSPAQAVLYDLDNGDGKIQGGTYMQTYIEEIPPAGVPVRIPLRFTTARDPGSPEVSGVTGDQNGYTLPRLDGQYAYAQFNARRDHKYKLGLTNVFYRNILQFQLPFDSIYFSNAACIPPPPPPPPPPPVTKPYFEVNGGDAAAGASIETQVATPCGVGGAVPNDDAGIVSWNNHGSPNYAGAGGQYGAFAMNFIQDFVTGQGNGRVGPFLETNELTFSNADYSGSVAKTQGLFGGQFEDAPCIDYWTDRPAAINAPPSSNPANWPSDTYYVDSAFTLSGGVIPAGRHITLYVDDNVAISGNITYAPGPYASRSDIPSFRLIVHGSIFIGAGVTALDGLYGAIPDAGGASAENKFDAPLPGTISTCSSGFTSYDPNGMPDNNMDVICAARLTVTGSVAANQIWLLRTGGSLGGAPAEVFTYSPEIWLAPSGLGGGTVGDYQSIVGLPPIL